MAPCPSAAKTCRNPGGSQTGRKNKVGSKTSQWRMQLCLQEILRDTSSTKLWSIFSGRHGHLVIASKNNHYGRTECSMGRGNGGCLLKTRKIHHVSYIFPGSHLTWGSWVPRVQLNLSPASYDPTGSNRLQVKEGAQ